MNIEKDQNPPGNKPIDHELLALRVRNAVLLEENERLRAWVQKAVPFIEEVAQLVPPITGAVNEAREAAEGLAEFIDDVFPEGDSCVADLPWNAGDRV